MKLLLLKRNDFIRIISHVNRGARLDLTRSIVDIYEHFAVCNFSAATCAAWWKWKGYENMIRQRKSSIVDSIEIIQRHYFSQFRPMPFLTLTSASATCLLFARRVTTKENDWIFFVVIPPFLCWLRLECVWRHCAPLSSVCAHASRQMAK